MSILITSSVDGFAVLDGEGGAYASSEAKYPIHSHRAAVAGRRMSLLINVVFSLTGLSIALVAAAVWLYRRPDSAPGRRFLFSVVAAYVLLSIYVIPFGASRVLVVGFHELTPADLRSAPTAIVLLGAESVSVGDWSGDSLSALGIVSAARTLEALRVYRMAPNAYIISSGGPPAFARREQSDAVVMRDALVQQGVSASRIFLEADSMTTYDQARLVKPLLRTLNASQVVLVTSDIHMRRSIAAFRAQGVQAIPAIARDPYLSLPLRKRVLPTHYGLECAASLTHEILGLAYYAARGWLRF